MQPRFTSFDDAWRWFLADGELEPLAEARERFTAGRAQFLAFQAPIAGAQLADAALDLQDQLTDIESLELSPAELSETRRGELHISLRSVGFQVIARTRPDDVLREEVPIVAARAKKVITSSPAIPVVIGPVNVFPDAVVLEVHDGGALAVLRGRLDLLDRADALGDSAAEYLPHITIATFRTAAAGDVLRQRLTALRETPPTHGTIRSIDFARWWFTGIDASEQPECDIIRSYRLRA